ncbi:MAG TPA: hypothetical protein VHY91_22990 [Pirellulales bacterium]|jgi:hypothetical protein|nr:hypothetical protein [Pirellulales bacterium]
MKVWLLPLLLLCPLAARADDSTKPAAFRTDAAGGDLPWYQLKPGEFPPRGSEHRVGGELVDADFVHRRGQFRAAGSGELVDFTLPSFGSVCYLGAEGDLRDVPLGTYCSFFLYQDASGAFTQAVSVRDQYSLLAAEGITLRLDQAALDQGKLLVTRHKPAQADVDLGHEELRISDKTRIWKGDQPIKPTDLAVGDELLVNLTGGALDQGLCTDIWVGLDTHKMATETERKNHLSFLKARGLAAWIDRVEGKNLTVTLFGDPADTAALLKDEGIVPTQWATEHRQVDCVVATPELRTYNPPVDRQRSNVLEYQEAPTDVFGSSGVRFVIEPNLLLEGFRTGHIVRLFVHPSWKVEDMPFGENVFSERPNFRADLEEPLQYPFRTDFANEQLPWYQLKPAEFPPISSHHLVSGELTKVDPVHRSGQFRADHSGEVVDFKLLPFASVRYLNGEAALEDMPLGTRYRFFLYQDAQGAFTQAGMIMDGVTRIDAFTRILGDGLTYRLKEARLDEGKLLLARQIDLIENYKGDKVRPPDAGHGEFAVDDQTRVWKGDQQIRLADLAVGDDLMCNQTGTTDKSRGRLTEIWVGTDTFKLIADRQQQKHSDRLKQAGFPGWITQIEGNELTISFFAGPGREFQGFFHDGTPSRNASLLRVDDDLLPIGAPVEAVKFKNGWLANAPVPTYGFRGARWTIESPAPPGSYQVGQVVRVFDPAWLVPPVAGK